MHFSPCPTTSWGGLEETHLGVSESVAQRAAAPAFVVTWARFERGSARAAVSHCVLLQESTLHALSVQARLDGPRGEVRQLVGCLGLLVTSCTGRGRCMMHRPAALACYAWVACRERCVVFAARCCSDELNHHPQKLQMPLRRTSSCWWFWLSLLFFLR